MHFGPEAAAGLLDIGQRPLEVVNLSLRCAIGEAYILVRIAIRYGFMIDCSRVQGWRHQRISACEVHRHLCCATVNFGNSCADVLGAMRSDSLPIGRVSKRIDLTVCAD
jgi:hypothetical protein